MTHPNVQPPPPTDAALVELTRNGDTAAYAELWHRHASTGRAAARSFTGSFDPEDLVSEAYTRIFRSIRAGGGPTTAFRAYLVRTIHNVAVTWSRQKRPDSLENAELLTDAGSHEFATVAGIDRRTVALAFGLLPERWQQVLWYTEVEGMNPREIAPILGMSANSVSALARRAKEGLRQAWIQAHLSSAALQAEHRWTVERLGQYMRKKSAARERTRIETHLGECVACTRVASEARRIEAVLPWALLPLVGSIGASTYALWSADAHRIEASDAPSIPSPTDGSPPMPPSSGRHAFPGGTVTAVSALVLGSVVALMLATGQNVVPSPGSSRELRQDVAEQDRAPADTLSLVAAEPADPVQPVPPPPLPPTTWPRTSPQVPAVPARPATDVTLPSDPSQQPPRPADAPVITLIDTGDGSDLWYPIVSGVAQPGAMVTVSNGTGEPVTVTAAPNGMWLTGQLTGFVWGTHTLTARQSTSSGISPPATATFTLASQPDIGFIVDDRLVSYSVSASRPGLVQVRTDGEADWFEAALSPAGEWYRWEGTLTFGPSAGTRIVSARFGSGTRWGPSTSVTLDLPDGDSRRFINSR